MSELRAKLAGAADAQGNLLADIAVNELSAQKQRIADYEVQARFALASIYDRAAEPPPAAPKPRAPVEEGPATSEVAPSDAAPAPPPGAPQ
jgi:hypothetical protein